MLNNTTDGWKSDWKLFVTFLGQQLQNGCTQDELDKLFGDCKIQWEGTIERKHISEIVAIVDVFLPEYIVKLREGGEIVLDGITLSVPAHSIERWNRFSIGDHITFSANLGDFNSPFSPVECKSLKSGKTIVIIRASNGFPM